MLFEIQVRKFGLQDPIINSYLNFYSVPKVVQRVLRHDSCRHGGSVILMLYNPQLIKTCATHFDDDDKFTISANCLTIAELMELPFG